MYKDKPDLVSYKNPAVHSGFTLCFLPIHASKHSRFGVSHVLGPALIKLVFFPFSCCIEFWSSSVIYYCKEQPGDGQAGPELLEKCWCLEGKSITVVFPVCQETPVRWQR